MAKSYISIFIVCLISGCLMLSSGVYGSHAAGGEITYEWLRDSTYRFYFKFYRDCSGIAEPGTPSLCYYNSCGTHRGSLRLERLLRYPDGTYNGIEVSPGCPGYPTQCESSSSNLPGYREWWYVAEMTLPARCDYWTFYVSISARNTNTNIAAGNLYIEATLNNLHVQNNNSPFFSVKPVPYVCVSAPYFLNNGAVDPDGDSLTFEFIRPRTAVTTCAASYNAADIAYRSTSFSLSEPFSTGNTFQFSTVTGEMTFTPVVQSVNTVSVRVNDYRNGVRIGSVMRDIQIRVVSCSNPPTSLVPISASVTGGRLSGGRIEGAANQPLRFCYNIVSDSPNRILVVKDNHALVAPGSFVQYAGQATDMVTGCFNWIPGCADTGLKILTITVKDSTCEPPGIAISRTYTLPVYIQSGSVSNHEVVICRGDEVRLASTGGKAATWKVLPGGDGAESLSCLECSDPVARPKVTTVYEGYASSGTCYHVDRIRVRVDNDTNLFTITPSSPHVLCRPGYVDLNVDISGPKPLSNLSCGITSIFPSTPLDTVEIIPKTSMQNTPNTGSTPFSGGSMVTARHQYLFRAADMRASGMYSGTLRSIAFNLSSIGAGAIYENVRISIACTDIQELDPNAGFVQGTELVYQSVAPVTMPPGGGQIYFDFFTPYNWDTTRNIVVDVCYTNTRAATPAYTYFYNNGYQSTLYSYDSSGSLCGAVPGGNIPVFASHEMPQISFGYQHAPESDFSYRWENGIFEPSARYKNPSVYISGSQKVWVHARSRHGCIISDTLDVYVPPPFEMIPRDAAVCLGDTVMLSVRNSVQTAWYENGFQSSTTLSCNQCTVTKAFPVTDVIYTAVAMNDVQCLDTLTIPVRVKPIPEVAIVNADTMIDYGDELQLLATGAEHYLWAPVTGLSDAYISNPVASPERSVRYVVTGIADGCMASDSILISVDTRGKLMIPTAFSPDGDGRNDVFRVVNLRFQKIVEFRVMNRWGKEVYNVHNGDEKGWDGTYNGQPQPVDTYYYIIRIAYPEGTMDTYTGDVTLVR